MNENDLSRAAPDGTQTAKEKPAYLAVLPSQVRYDETLSSSAKLIYAEISALSEQKGYAWADNEYFARIYGITVRTVIRQLNELQKAGYLCIENSGTTRRRLWCNLNHPAFPGTAPPPSDKNVTATDKNVSASDKNVTAIYNDREERKKRNDPPTAPQGAASVPKWKPERFAGLWDYYPRHTSKQAAAKAWDKLKPSDELIAQMGRALRRQKAWDEWQRGIGIPHLSTYLNQRRWEDELDEAAARSAEEAPREEALPWI